MNHIYSWQLDIALSEPAVDGSVVATAACRYITEGTETQITYHAKSLDEALEETHRWCCNRVAVPLNLPLEPPSHTF